jgi:hypothetical protein
MPLSFLEYLNWAELDGPDADFVHDIKHDKWLPGVTTWDQLETYLITRGSDSAVREVAKSVWTDYERVRLTGVV